jgi:outer membrane protein assembly factor BamB
VKRLFVLILAISVVSLSGCGIFGGDDDEELEPTELLDFEETLDVRRSWSTRIGKGTEFLRLGLMPAGDGSRVFAASYDGNVVALNADTGRREWVAEVEAELTAGPGLGEDFVVVITRDGMAICLRADNGEEVWRSRLDGESVAVPAIRNGTVVVATIDGLLRGLSLFDGSIIWSLEQSSPALTLRGAAQPVVVGTTVVAGFDNGRLLAANLVDGTTEWETMLSPPSGRSDLDRLADVDGALAVVGQDIYAAGYQGRVAALASESGQILWSRELSSYAGVGAEWDRIYTLTDEGELVAMQRRNGSDAWRQAALIRREPTPPTPFDTAVVVGDFEGYLHFFDSGDGRPVARERVGKGMISGKPVVIAGRLYVQSESGQLYAFEVPAPERPADEQPESNGDG